MGGIHLKFKNDSHRKAVFANMFSGSDGRRSKVNSINVQNFETKMKMAPPKRMKHKSIRYKSQKVNLKDVRELGSEEACKLCKRKNLPLTSGECKECVEEQKRFAGDKEARRKAALDKLNSINSFSDFRDAFGFGLEFDQNYDHLTDDEKEAVREKFIEFYDRKVHVGSRVRTWPQWVESGDLVYGFGHVVKVENGRDQFKGWMKKFGYFPDDTSVLFTTSRALRDGDQRRRGRTADQGKAAVYYKRGRKHNSEEKHELNKFLTEVERNRPFLGMKSEIERYAQPKPFGYFRNHIKTNGKQWAFVGNYASEERLLRAERRAKIRVRAKTGSDPELKLIKTKFSYKDPFSSNYPGKNHKFALYIVERDMAENRESLRGEEVRLKASFGAGIFLNGSGLPTKPVKEDLKGAKLKIKR